MQAYHLHRYKRTHTYSDEPHLGYQIRNDNNVDTPTNLAQDRSHSKGQSGPDTINISSNNRSSVSGTKSWLMRRICHVGSVSPVVQYT